MSLQQPVPLCIHLLGGFRITIGEQTIPPELFRLRKSKNLIKLLALAPSHRLHRDQLIEHLWPESDPETAANSLHQTVYAARRVFSAHDLPAHEIFPFKDEFLSLCPEMPLWIDAEAFETAAKKARSSQDPAAFQAALDLYPSDLLPEDRYEDWAASRRETLRQEHLRLLLGSAVLQESRQEFQAAIASFQRALAVDPVCEEAHAGLMRLFAHSGQRSAALAQYEACRQALEKELGVLPGSATAALYQQISDGTLTPQLIPTAQAQPASSHPPTLPTYLISFVGRQGLLTSIRERLADPTCRLLTLVGPGGSGKTRLAVEAVSSLSTDFPDGIFFIPLVGLQSPSAIIFAAAQALGITFYENVGPLQQLLDHLRNKTLLLVLDNFEHLLAASALQGEEGTEIVTRILEAAPGVKAMATSRIRLDLLYETLLPISGMHTSQQPAKGSADVLQFSAVRLFLEGARRVAPDFEPDAVGLEKILEICRLVEGMPLAILLAAAWTRLLSPAEIAAQIAKKNLDLLESRSRDLPERQRSLRAVFDHSLRLLDESDRHLFATLSVFRGGFTPEAAGQICGASLNDLARLADHSLLHRTAGGRYELHELLRQYGEEKLVEFPDGGDDLRERHAGYFIDLLQHFETEYMSPRPVAALSSLEMEYLNPRRATALSEMDDEIGNARTAWEWAVQHRQADRLKASLDGLEWFYRSRYRFMEGEQTFRQAFDAINASKDNLHPEILVLKANLLKSQASCNYGLSRFESGENQIHQALDLLDEAALAGQDVRQKKAALLHLFAMPSMGMHSLENSFTMLEASLSLYRELGDRTNEAHVLSTLGRMKQNFGQAEESTRLWQEVLAIALALNLPKEIHWAQIHLIFAQSQSGLGNYLVAEQKLAESIAYCREVGDTYLQALSNYNLAQNRHVHGQYSQMVASLEECARIYQNIDIKSLTARVWMKMGIAYSSLGRNSLAGEYLTRSSAYFTELGHVWGIGAVNWHLGDLALVAGRFTQASELLQKGLDDLMLIQNYALVAQAQPSMVIAYLNAGDLHQARQTLAEALRRAAEHRNFPAQANALASAALFAARSRHIELAVELDALAASIPYLFNSAVFQTLVFKPLAELTKNLPPEFTADARERGRQRDLWQTIRELQTAPEFTQN